MTTALYRRYRPETFVDVIGQEHVTVPLMQALRTGRVNHAYLFSGPRGCGKTTSARILARCLNCEQGPTPEPCGVCDSCVALARGGPGSVDVIEIDAASHGGVDDARDLRERASYGPAQSRYKVYIIDEAHMVTPQGFNALLKIVEEPPEHVKFVFATTEPEKVIGTIRSRTHHYPFRLVPPARLADYLEQICAAEGVAVAPGVLSFVVRAGGGSVRDSLSVLDQLIAGSGDDGLTYDGAVALLGFTDAELLDATVDALAAGDGAGVFRQVDKVVESGHDPRRFVEDLLERLRDLIVIAATQEGAAAVLRGIPADQLDRMRVQQAAFGPGALSRAADVVNAGLTEMTGTTSPRLQLELICARVLLPGAAGEQGYAARLDRLERRLDLAASAPVAAPVVPAGAPPADAAPAPAPAVGAPADASATASLAAPARPITPPPGPSAAPATASPTVAAPQVGSAPAAKTAPAATPAGALAQRPGPSSGALDTDAVRRAWPDVLTRVYAMRRATWTFLSAHAQVVDLDGDRLLLGIATSGLATAFRSGNHAEIVRQALIEQIGLDVRVEGQPLGEAAPGGSRPGADPSPNTGGTGQEPPSGWPPAAPVAAAPASTTATSAEPNRPHDTATPDEPPLAPDMVPPDPLGSDVWDRDPLDLPRSSAAPGAPQRPAPPAESAAPRRPTSPRQAAARAAASRSSTPLGVSDEADPDHDENIADAGAVGQAVVERLLGARVIEEYDE